MINFEALRKPFGDGALIILSGIFMTLLSDKTPFFSILPGWYMVVIGCIIGMSQVIFLHASYETERVIRTVAGHALRTVIRCAFFLCVTLVYTWGYDWQLQAAFFTILFGLFAIEFDIFYAAIKGRHWLYLGSVATQDKTFRRLPGILLALDVIVFLFGIYWFINPF